MTEKKYFNNLRVIERVRLKIITKEAGVTRADQILNKSIRFYNNEFLINEDIYDPKRDLIACVFDKDDNNTDTVFEKIRENDNDEIKIIYSNPSFEYWILCHKEFNKSSSLNQDKVYRLVKEKMGIDTKREDDLYSKTREGINYAIENAKEIKRIHENNNIELISRNSTPLTLVFLIIEIINKYK